MAEAEDGRASGRVIAKKEGLEGKYQKQVDDMFLFDYRCCMKKQGILRTPLITLQMMGM